MEGADEEFGWELDMLLWPSMGILEITNLRDDDGRKFETSALENLCGGKFTLSTQLMKPNHLV